MYAALTSCLKTARTFDELIGKMHQLGYRVTLSQNVKAGISGVRIVRNEDVNRQTERQYKPGFKLSEITNKLKIADIKTILDSNQQRSELNRNTTGLFKEISQTENSKTNVGKEIQKTIEEFLKPTYTAPDDELLRRKKRKFR